MKLFLTSSANFVAHDLVKWLVKPAKQSKLAFINTAAEVEEGDKKWLKDDRDSLVKAGFKIFDYTLTDKKQNQIKEDLSNTDVIFLSGGNTFYLLEKIQQTGFKKVIHEFISKGKIYIGSSAGSLVAGPDIYPSYRLDNVKKAPNLKGYKGLELVDFVVFPHWGSKHFKDLYLNKRLNHAYTTKHKIILLTDYQYVRLVDECAK